VVEGVIRLGEFIQIIKGSKAETVFNKPVESSYPYIQIDDLHGNGDAKFTTDTSGTFAQADDVIIAWDGANAGTIGFGLSGYIGSTLAILRSRIEIYTPYLGYFLYNVSNG
jgi:type I restriction enzyme S subunit